MSDGLLIRLARKVFQPPVIAFAIMAVPVVVLGMQMRPAAQDELVADIRQRYGYQHTREAQARNAKALESLFERRHQHMSEYTAGFQKSSDQTEAKK